MNLPFAIGTTIFIINIIFIICLIFIERKNPSVTWAWIVVLTFVPFMGFIMYLFFGQSLTKEKLFNQKIADDERKKIYINKLKGDYIPNSDSNESSDLIKMNYNNAHATYTQYNKTTLYYEGNNLFRDILEEINNAKKFIHIEYYIFKNDGIGTKVMEALTKKASEGVEVKLLVDSIGNKLKRSQVRKFKKAGGKYSIFFPSLIPYLNRKINYRNHRKILVIDGKLAFIGGFNVGDEYLNKNKKIGYWRDTHLKIEGEAINDLEARFLLDWSYTMEEPLNEDYNQYFSPIIKNQSDYTVGMQIVSSGPDHDYPQIKNAYVKIINNSKEKLYIQTPYFVPDDCVYECLKLSALSGIDVKLMLPGKPDHKFMAWVANSYVEELLECGVKVYLYDKGFLHCKTMVSDGCICSVGTANLDIRSFELNFETNAFIYNKKVCIEMENQFLKDLEHCRSVNLEKFKNRSLLNRFLESICRLLSPLM